MVATIDDWINNTAKYVPNFVLVPYTEGEEVDGQDITDEAQLPKDDVGVYCTYYGNHRATAQGTLTGMIKFHCSIPFNELKKTNSRYMKWLFSAGIYLNRSWFAADDLTSIGYVAGAHPNYFRVKEVIQELRSEFKLEKGETQFQMTPRNMSVEAIKGKPETRFYFYCIVVQFEQKNAGIIRDLFQGRLDPAEGRILYPVTGQYLFVSFRESGSWPTKLMVQMARGHTDILNQVEPFYLTIGSVHQGLLS